MIYQKFLIYFFIFKYFILKIIKIGEINMKEKTKKFLQKYLIGFILGFVSVGIVAVYAETYFPSNDVTYDNTKSGLSSTDVQGAIDELYGVCFPPKTGGDAILDDTDIVTSGDGLYEDEYEDGRYFYKGGNPNNYVTFNNEDAGWRIVSIESDGTIKIMKTASIGNYQWDSSNSNNWARPASLNTYLNSTYYNGLNSTAQSQIVAKDWSIGGVTYGNNDLATQINNENGTKWKGKVALVTMSEYIRSNSNKNRCGNFSLYNSNYSSCKNTTWMFYSSNYWWTLSPFSSTDNTLRIAGGGNVNGDHPHGSSNAVRPVVYLSPDVKLSGSGTSSNPYTIS